MAANLPVTAPPELGSLESRMSHGIPSAIEDWNLACAALAAWEQQYLNAKSTGEVLGQHERWLSDLLAWGCAILAATREPGFSDKSLSAVVEERVNHLEDKYGVWHCGMTSDDGDRIINAAFN